MAAKKAPPKGFKTLNPIEVKEKIAKYKEQPLSQSNRVEKKTISIPTDNAEFEKVFGFDKSKVNILICTPCYGGMVTNTFTHSLLLTKEFLDRLGIRTQWMSIGNESLITRGRNTCVSYFLTHKEFSHIFFIDADITWKPDAVLNLLADRKDVVCGVYPKKGYNFSKLEMIIKNNPNNWQKLIPRGFLDYVVNFESSEVRIVRNCVKVKDGPTGFMLIERQVFDTLIEYHNGSKESEGFTNLTYVNDLGSLNPNDYSPDSFYTFFDCLTDPIDRRYLSEDYAFCRRVQAVGKEVWIDVSCALMHTGTHTFDGNLLDALVVQQQN